MPVGQGLSKERLFTKPTHIVILSDAECVSSQLFPVLARVEEVASEEGAGAS